MKYFWLMLQFLTRIPIKIEISVHDGDLHNGIKYFPLIGLMIGSLNALFYLLIAMVCSKNIAIILGCLFVLLLTGALHLDGLADTCDGVFSARPKEKILEIMKDSRIGSNGVIAIFFDLALKIILLTEIKGSIIVKALVLAPVISKTAMVFLIHSSQPARQDGLGTMFIGKSSKKDLFIAFGLGVFFALGLFPYQAAAILGINVLAMIIFRGYIAAKIGGMTGDTLGAANEVSEIVTLATLTFFR